MLMDIAGCRALYVPDIELMVKVDVRGAHMMDIIQNLAKYIVAVKRTKSFNVVYVRNFPVLG